MKYIFLVVISLVLVGCIPTNNQNPLAGKVKKVIVNQVDSAHGLNETYVLEFIYNNAKVANIMFNGSDYISFRSLNNNRHEFVVKDVDYGFKTTYYVYSVNDRIDSISYLDTVAGAEINYFTFKYSGDDLDSLLLPANQGIPYAYNVKYTNYAFLQNYFQSNVSWDYLQFSMPYHYDQQLDYVYESNLNNVNVPLQIPIYDVFGPDWTPYFNTGFPLYLYVLRLNNLKAFLDNKNLLQNVNDAYLSYEYTSERVSKVIVNDDNNSLVQYISLEYY